MKIKRYAPSAGTWYSQRRVTVPRNGRVLDRLISVCKQHVKILQDYSPSLSTLNSFLIRPDDPSVLGKAAGQILHPI